MENSKKELVVPAVLMGDIYFAIKAYKKHKSRKNQDMLNSLWDKIRSEITRVGLLSPNGSNISGKRFREE